MKLLQSLCLASVFAKDKEPRSGSGRTCLISELWKPDHFEKWECFHGEETTSPVSVPEGAVCYLVCKEGYNEYIRNGKDYHRCTNTPMGDPTDGRNKWYNAGRKNMVCVRDIKSIIEELDAAIDREEDNNDRLEDIEETNLFTAFETISQQEVKVGVFGDENFVFKLPETVPADAKFVLADIFINDAENQNWSVTFSKDKYTDCRGFSLADKGTNPLSNFNQRTQTTTVSYQADQVEASEAFPRFGQWSSSIILPMDTEVDPNTKLEYAGVNVCIDGKDEQTENASIILYVRGYYSDISL